MSVSVVVENGAYTIGEGPHWDPENNCLLYVDIMAGDVHKWDAATNTDTKVHLDDVVGFVVPQKSGGYLVGLGRTLAHLDWDTGKTTILHEVDHGTTNRFNDAKCDPSGRLWAGTMGYEKAPAVVEPEVAALYSLDVDGQLRTQLSKISISNGMAWSADHKTMYYIDSIPGKVFAFDFDISTGTLSNQRTCVDFESRRAEWGVPDGMCIDTDGNLWVAGYDGGNILKFDPRTGSLLQTVSIPASKTTSCCFGGPNYDELYVTTCRKGLSDEQLQNVEPLAGSVFKVTGLGVKGTPAPIYNA